MKQIVKLQDIPETLNIQELMEVKGGADDNKYICIFSAAVKGDCDAQSSGVIIQVPTEQPKN